MILVGKVVQVAQGLWLCALRNSCLRSAFGCSCLAVQGPDSGWTWVYFVFGRKPVRGTFLYSLNNLLLFR